MAFRRPNKRVKIVPFVVRETSRCWSYDNNAYIDFEDNEHIVTSGALSEV